MLPKKHKNPETDNVVHLETVNVCPECRSRFWEVIETGLSGGPFCRCAQCGWEAEKSEDVD